MSALVFLDTETLGLALGDHIWEFAAIRREYGKPDVEIQFFIEHDVTKAPLLPEKFRVDHDARYNPDEALPVEVAVLLIDDITRDRAHIVGAVPNFDTERLARLLRKFGIEPKWDYRLRCVETLYAGFSGTFVGGLSAVADMLGIPHPAAHTAMGDVLTTRAVYDNILGY